MAITVTEYRQILNDQTSTEEQIKKRLQYLESFCRNVIKLEFENYQVGQQLIDSPLTKSHE